MSGEAASRAEPVLPTAQIELAMAVVATGKPVVLAITSGRPLVLGELAEMATAILMTWFLGHEAGSALADILFGEWNPSARLPVCVPRSIGEIPINYAHRPTGRPASSERYTSKYLDVPNEPRWGFGYGISYANFDYHHPAVDRKALHSQGMVHVDISVTNSGCYAGEETIQIYLRDPIASVARPVLELNDFIRCGSNLERQNAPSLP
jgi:beta-glucosidase